MPGYVVGASTPVALTRGGVERNYQRIFNVSATGGPTLWISRSSATPAVNAAGSFPIAPGTFEEFKKPSQAPMQATFGIADGASCQVTVEEF